MGLFDIILGITLLVAVAQGFRRGLVLEVMGLASFVIAGYGAYIFCDEVAELFNFTFDFKEVAGFIILFVVLLFTLVAIARMATKLLKVVGLGGLNGILGGVVSLFKYLFILAIVFVIFESLNSNGKIMSKEKVDESLLYKPMKSVSSTLFPYFESAKSSVTKFKDKHFE